MVVDVSPFELLAVTVIVLKPPSSVISVEKLPDVSA